MPEPLQDEQEQPFEAGTNEYATLAKATEKEHPMLDLSTPEMTQRFAEAPVYEKTAVVTIREVEPGTPLETRLADGRVETKNVATEDRRHVVTNPDGEEYLVGADKVADRYTPLGDGRYKAKGMVRAFPNPTGGEITIMAPWGEEQHGGSEAMLATLYDPANPDAIGTDRYIIGGEEFKNTYALKTEQDASWS